MSKIYDLIIVGAGPAGLTAAIYAARKGLNTLVLSSDIGGQIAKAAFVENFPGFLEISGVELAQKMFEQARNQGAEIIFEEVIKINAQKNKFEVKTQLNKYHSKAIILAYGKTPRKLGAKNEDLFLGKGVSYCATCDMPLFKNKIIAVIGGGNSTFDAAIYGSSIAKKVYLIHRREEFRADKKLVEKAKKLKNIEFVLNSVVREIKGEKFVNSILIENTKTKEISEIPVDGVFVEIGYEVKTDMVAHLVKLDEFKQIIVDKNCATSHPGIFAAGDITNTLFKQAVVAAGEGCKAALSAYNWLKGTKENISTDWVK